MSQLYLTHMRISVCFKRHSDVKLIKVNATWGDWILTVYKKTFKDLVNIKSLKSKIMSQKIKMLHEFEKSYRVQNLVLNLFNLFLC